MHHTGFITALIGVINSRKKWKQRSNAQDLEEATEEAEEAVAGVESIEKIVWEAAAISIQG